MKLKDYVKQKIQQIKEECKYNEKIKFITFELYLNDELEVVGKDEGSCAQIRFSCGPKEEGK